MGTAISKAGFAGEESPRLILPTVYGTPNYKLDNYEEFFPPDRIYQEYFIGEEAMEFKEGLELGYPIKRGIIKDWNAMEKIWHYIFYQGLRVDPSEHLVLMTEYPLNTKSNREKIVDIMFETFNIPGINFLIILCCITLFVIILTRSYIKDN